jgi:SAM-dependent methyltransferase
VSEHLLEKFLKLKKKLGSYYWDLYAKPAFLDSCAPGARVLDVGCGNNSPQAFKTQRPDIHYVGIDIADYRQTTDPHAWADEYIIASPSEFNASLEAMPRSFDAVVSAHNIEHCDDPDRTLEAMLNAVRPGGRIFLAFPCEASVRFPRREGTLNFFDDPTHKRVPSYIAVCRTIEAHGFSIEVAIKRYRPLVRVLSGLVNEPSSFIHRRTAPGTWALYGFETIIWASRSTRG